MTTGFLLHSYTPNDVVDDIVEATLASICEEIDRAVRQEIMDIEEQIARSTGKDRETLAANLRVLRADFDRRVLGLRVLDPAMGSGHFLIRACQYLAEQIATNPHTRDPIAERGNSHEIVRGALAFRGQFPVAVRCDFGLHLGSMSNCKAQCQHSFPSV